MLDEKDLQAIAAMLAPINTRLDSMETRLDKLEAGQQEIKADMATKKDLKETEGRMIALQEAWFGPQFSAVVDGQKLIQDKMLPMEALDTVEDRLDDLEADVKLHSREIEELKKAQ